MTFITVVRMRISISFPDCMLVGHGNEVTSIHIHVRGEQCDGGRYAAKVRLPPDPRQPCRLGPVRGSRAVQGHTLPAVLQG